MSLINQMLKDLDARCAAHGAGTTLPNDVRPLPAVAAARWPWLLGGCALFVLAGGLSVYCWSILPNGVASPANAVPAAAQPVAVAGEVPASAPDPRALEAIGMSLRMADFIDAVPERASGKVPPQSAARVETSLPPSEKAVMPPKNMAELPARKENAPAAPANVMPLPEAKAVKAPFVDKTDAIGSPRERADSAYRKAIAAVNQGRVAEAFDELPAALRHDAGHTAARQLLVKLLLEAKRTDDAMQILQEGLQGQPAQIGWAMSLARLQMDRGDSAGAWRTLDFSLPAGAGSADYQGFAAHVLQRLGRSKEAVLHYQVASRLAPADGRWWLGLGLSLESDGRSAEAREAFMRARQCGNLGADLMSLVEQKLR